MSADLMSDVKLFQAQGAAIRNGDNYVPEMSW